jgi:nitroreductase
MNFFELISGRYSVRAYKPDPIPDALLARVLEAARLAPTAANRQPFVLIVLRTADRQTELKRVYNRDWFLSAPLVIAACGAPDRAWVRRDGKNYVDVDVAIALDHLILAATDLGLGTCWIANFDPTAAREVLCLPDTVEPVAFTPLGYPADVLRPKQRKPLADLVRYEHW